MKSLNKMVVALTIAFAAIAANAADSYLYWMASEEINNLISGETTDWSKARVNYGGSIEGNSIVGGTWLNPYFNGETIGGVDYVTRSVAVNGPVAWGAFDGSLGYNFIFELLNSDGDIAGFLSQQYSWVSYAIDSNQTGVPSEAGTYLLTGVVPEPTSGLLMLFGLAGLALRRRKMA